LSRRQKESFLDDLFHILKVMPTWVGPILAVVVFVLLRFVIPSLLPANAGVIDAGSIWGPLFAMLSWLFAGCVLLAWVAAEIWKLMNRRLVDGQTDLASIKNISWRDFERLVSDAYRRKGYLSQVVGTNSGDGGVDIRLTGHGETVLVQCKQWKAWKVGVATVRELLGVMVSERADKGIVVTSGRFTQEARAFARQNPRIELVDGPELNELIRGVQAASGVPRIAPPQMPVQMPPMQTQRCPLCDSEMIMRTARKGQNAGSQFWGCSKYPVSGCRGTRQMSRKNG
jgi:restriction system protein